jgi:hypothetical protein
MRLAQKWLLANRFCAGDARTDRWERVARI